MPNESPSDMLKKISASEEDKQNIELLISKYPELSELKDSLTQLIPDHDRLLVEVIFAGNPEGLLYEHHILLNGLIARSKGLVGALIREIRKENMPAIAAILRAQCETLAAACYAERCPDKLTTVLYGSREDNAKVKMTNILTQIEHANKKYPGILKDYNSLSELYHPNARSHFSSSKIVNEKERIVDFSSGGFFLREDAIKTIQMTYYWTKWFLETSKSLHLKLKQY